MPGCASQQHKVSTARSHAKATHAMRQQQRCTDTGVCHDTHGMMSDAKTGCACAPRALFNPSDIINMQAQFALHFWDVLTIRLKENSMYSGRKARIARDGKVLVVMSQAWQVHMFWQQRQRQYTSEDCKIDVWRSASRRSNHNLFTKQEMLLWGLHSNVAWSKILNVCREIGCQRPFPPFHCLHLHSPDITCRSCLGCCLILSAAAGCKLTRTVLHKTEERHILRWKGTNNLCVPSVSCSTVLATLQPK